MRRRLVVHAAQRVAMRVERDVALRKLGVQAGPGELVDAEAAREEPALVGAPLELDEEHAWQALLDELHAPSLPCSGCRLPSGALRCGGALQSPRGPRRGGCSLIA